MNKRICTLALVLLTLLSTALPALALGAGPQGPTDPQEVEAFADAFFAAKMAEYHIPGAVFVLVKDGQILFAKGYGYADLESQTPVVPEETVFCAGSVGKLFTSTAVMQLAERGLIDLDDDVNQYLDLFQIKDTYPEPVTFAHLLTHTGGFDEREVGIWVEDMSKVMPLGEYLAAAMPPRVRPPGQVTQYSNHGMALAGYLVEVISGVPFDEYVKENIFQPLSMNRSTFRQPIPPLMAPDLAVGYTRLLGNRLPAPVQYSNIVPAGMLHVTAKDMASFMIAHLQEGRYGEGELVRTASWKKTPSRRCTGSTLPTTPACPVWPTALWSTCRTTGVPSGILAAAQRTTACSFCYPTMAWACSCPPTSWTAGCRTT